LGSGNRRFTRVAAITSQLSRGPIVMSRPQCERLILNVNAGSKAPGSRVVHVHLRLLSLPRQPSSHELHVPAAPRAKNRWARRIVALGFHERRVKIQQWSHQLA